MRILLVGNYIVDSQESMQRYTGLLDAEFTKARHEVRVIRPTVAFGGLKFRNGVGKWLGYVDKFVIFPLVLWREAKWADVVHICDHSNAWYVNFIAKIPHIITCHDLLAVRSALGEVPENKTGWSGRRLQRSVVNGLTKSRNIVCDSDATLADVRRIVRTTGKRVTRVYIGPNYDYRAMGDPESSSCLLRLGIGPLQSFVLHVGGNQWYKNRPGVMRIFSELLKNPQHSNLILVMAGKPWTNGMRSLAKSLGIEPSCRELVNVSNEDLCALYSRAETFLFPSLEEGFGWPIIEAQACGCLVVTSNRPPMTEIGGDAAVYIDPSDERGAAKVLTSIIGSRPFRRQESLKNAARFSTSHMIHGYLELYTSILAGEDPALRRQRT